LAIRITSGEWGGRFIKSPEGRDTRPTSSITRQALFNILAERVDDATMLDLFAGSGVVSAEALSRGAKYSTLVEFGKAPLQLIRANFQSLQALDRVRIIQQDIRKIEPSQKPWGTFDLIYADPPFVVDYPDLRPFLQWLNPNGVAIFEMPSRSLPSWSTDAADLRRYGESTLAFFY